METKPKLEVVICKNTLEDGNVCNAEIKITHKFCNGCGNKVDKQMFEKSVELCRKCKAELVPEYLFCSECGERVTQKGNGILGRRMVRPEHQIHAALLNLTYILLYKALT